MFMLQYVYCISMQIQLKIIFNLKTYPCQTRHIPRPGEEEPEDRDLGHVVSEESASFSATPFRSVSGCPHQGAPQSINDGLNAKGFNNSGKDFTAVVLVKLILSADANSYAL